MKIFEKRPLCLILFIMLAVFSFFIEASLFIKASIFIFTLTIFALTFLTKIFNPKKIPFIRVASLASAISIGISILWSLSFFSEGMLGEEKTVKGTVMEVSEGYQSTKITVAVDEVNGDEESFKLFFNYYYETEEPEIGDEVSFKATLGSVKDYLSDGEYTYFYKDGITVVATDVSELKITPSSSPHRYKFLAVIRSFISNTLINRTNEDTGGFLSALLIGDKSHLDANTALNFRRIGISHILALSGMHLAIITHALERLLRALNLHKRARIITTALFTVLYMAVVGFTPSITRSGVMLLIYYLLFLISRHHDSITSLFIAVSVIVFLSPTSVFDISLWLSAFATLGVIISSSIYKSHNERRNIFMKALNFCLSSVVASFFAISCTLVFSILEFKSVSLISIFTTVIFSFPMLLFIYAGMLLLLLGGLIPFGNLVIIFSDLIKEAADMMASPTWVLASADFLAVRIITVLFTVFLFLFLIIDLKRKKACIISLSVLFSSIFLLSGALTALERAEETVYTDYDQKQDTLVVKSDARLFAIENGDTSFSDAYHIYSLLTEEKATYLDELVLTAISDSMTCGIQPLIDNIRVGTVKVPAPRTNYELDLCRNLSELLSKYGTDMKFYESSVSLGKYEYEELYRTNYFQGESSEIIYTLSDKNTRYAYLSSNVYEIASVMSLNKLSECDVLILGYKGARSKEFDILLGDVKQIICIGKSDISEEANVFYREKDVEIICSESKELLFQ